jgi:type IV pilus assembly protein PilC
MLFKYNAIDQTGKHYEGEIDALNQDVAITALQRKGYVIESIVSADRKGSILKLSLFERVSNKEVVILSRQISTLFEAQVSALRVFRLLSSESTNPTLQKILTTVADDLQAGSTISGALLKHPKAFSGFYVSMVKSGEESGKLDETFIFLADYLDRTYELTSKANHALIYPAFIIATFIGVMTLMLTLVIPKISGILEESGQEVPIYTKITLGISHFMTDFGVFIFAGLAIGGVFFMRWAKTEAGATYVDEMKIRIPFVGELYRKLYLARISDNLSTMLQSGIAIVRALEITSEVVGNIHYSRALTAAKEQVKNGIPLSQALAAYPEIPGMVVQMIKVGEETGELGKILKTLSSFYRREVATAVDTLVDMIEPIMIVLLGGGVGVLLASVLLPIYSITTSIE